MVNNLQKMVKIILIIFFLFLHLGSPPTLLSADVNSFPGYRIYKTIKFLYLSNQSHEKLFI